MMTVETGIATLSGNTAREDGQVPPNQPLELSIPDAAHSIPRGLPCLLSGLAAQPHVRGAELASA